MSRGPVEDQSKGLTVGGPSGLRVGVLGSLEVVGGAGPVQIGAPKQRALLVLLALRAGQTVSTGELTDGLWGDDPPRTAAKTLQTYVAGLRRVLPEAMLRTSPGGYRLDVDPHDVDAIRFEAAVASARRARAAGDPGGAVETLVAAIGWWRGAALVDAADQPGLTPPAQRLEELRRVAVEDVAELRLEAGAHQELVGDLEAAVAAEPLRERRWSQLMTALYRSGRQADALRAYRRLRDVLGEELGIDPSADLVRLEQSILLQEADLDWVAPPTPLAAPPDARAADRAPVEPPDDPGRSHNLPIQATSFIGRNGQLAELADLLGSSRLVTCTGPGGVGKTRLAIQAAWERLDAFRNGVWLVELAAATDGELVAGLVAEVIGVRDEPGRPVIEQLVDALRHKSMLIVLDNCEHLVGACARLAHALVRSCEHVRLLATSREPLGVEGERVLRVPSLSLPDPGVPVSLGRLWEYEAARLFAERGAAQRPGFVVDDGDVASVLSICRQVDGIPLAIELAAARLRSLSLDDLESRLQDRFRLLTGGHRAALPRQQTLRALIDWSYDLLSESERTVLRRLAVFAGGFDVAAAELVVAGDPLDPDDVLDIVTSLADKSLVQADPSAATVRFRLTETVRQYAGQRLVDAGSDETSATQDAHAHAFVRLAETAATRMEGPDQLDWLQRLDVEHDNLRAAFAHLDHQATGAGEAMRLAASLWRYWSFRGFLREGIEVLGAALDHPGARGDTRPRAAALAAFANLQLNWGDRLAGQDGAAEGLRIARALGDSSLAASCLVTMSNLRFGRQPIESLRAAETAVELARESASDLRLAQAYRARSLASSMLGDAVGARADIDRALALARRTGNPMQIVISLNNLACTELEGGEIEAAETHAHEAHEMAMAVKCQGELPYVATTLATLNLLRGHHDVARRLALDALAIVSQTSERAVLPSAALLLAVSVSTAGEADRAAFLHGAADAFGAAGNSLDPEESRLRDADHAKLRRILGDEPFDAAHARGAVLDSADQLLGYLRD